MSQPKSSPCITNQFQLLLPKLTSDQHIGMETQVAFVLQGAVAVRSSRTKRRPLLPLNWPRVFALGRNIGAWALIILLVRHFLRP